jgi:hypothetical protein
MEIDTQEFVENVKIAYIQRVDSLEKNFTEKLAALETWIAGRIAQSDQLQDERRDHSQATMMTMLTSHCRESDLQMDTITHSLEKLDEQATSLEKNTIARLETKVISLETKIQELQGKVTIGLEEKAQLLDTQTQELKQYQSVSQGKTIMLSIIIPIVISLFVVVLNYLLRK